MTGEAGDILAADSAVGPEEAVVAEVVALTAEIVPRSGEDKPPFIAVVEVTVSALPAPEGRVDASRALSDVVGIVAVPAGTGGPRGTGGGEKKGAADERESGNAARSCQGPEYC
jgi:hypothetical protein